MKIARRQALTLVAIGTVSSNALAQHGAHGASVKTPSRQFFSEAEFAVIGRVADLIIPPDSHSPGAAETGVAQHIDFVAANSTDVVKASWRQRLAGFLELSRKKFGAEFMQLRDREQAALLDLVAANEQKPQMPADHFFVDMKGATLFAYYSSELGLLKELGYRGNQVLDTFAGCPHEKGKHDASS